MDMLERMGYNISKTNNNKILRTFYATQGVTEDTYFSNWMHSVDRGELPAYGSVTRAIRKCRENNPQWRKARKQKEVEHVKEEVGY